MLYLGAFAFTNGFLEPSRHAPGVAITHTLWNVAPESDDGGGEFLYLHVCYGQVRVVGEVRGAG